MSRRLTKRKRNKQPPLEEIKKKIVRVKKIRDEFHTELDKLKTKEYALLEKLHQENKSVEVKNILKKLEDL